MCVNACPPAPAVSQRRALLHPAPRTSCGGCRSLGLLGTGQGRDEFHVGFGHYHSNFTSPGCNVYVWWLNSAAMHDLSTGNACMLSSCPQRLTCREAGRTVQQALRRGVRHGSGSGQQALQQDEKGHEGYCELGRSLPAVWGSQDRRGTALVPGMTPAACAGWPFTSSTRCNKPRDTADVPSHPGPRVCEIQDLLAAPPTRIL